MRRVRVLVVSSVLLVTGAVLSYDRLAESPGRKMSAAAERFLDSLDEGQKAKARLPYDSKERVVWNFVPLDTRKGLALKDMTEEQRQLARELATTALSESGYKKAETIVRLERLLQQLEGPNRRWPRDWHLYYFTVYGDPQGESAWGLSIEGHHLSLNFVVEDGKVVASTPQFMGANPATVKTGGEDIPAGTRVLADEEQLAFDLLARLAATQRMQAVVSPEAPREIRAPGEPQPPQEPAQGLQAGKMSDDQRQLLEKLIGVYASAMPEAVASERLAAIQKAGLENVTFAWFGAEKPGVGHGYRVQGPTFLIEFVNTQPDAEGNPANHIHCVWRDLRGDFALPVE
ncbi:MAG TPA: DUF3500 domain-containing protein [Planctomycetaceae bacterium]